MVLTRGSGSCFQESLTFSMTQPPSLLWKFGAELITMRGCNCNPLPLSVFLSLSVSFYLFLSICPSVSPSVRPSIMDGGETELTDGQMDAPSVCLSGCLCLTLVLCSSHQGVNRGGGGAWEMQGVNVERLSVPRDIDV